MDVDLFSYLFSEWRVSMISSEATFYLIHMIFNQNNIFNTKTIVVELNVNNFHISKKWKKYIKIQNYSYLLAYLKRKKNSFVCQGNTQTLKTF